MWYFTDVANWFDRNKNETDKILDKWVEDSNYNQGVMIVAATTHAFTTFGAGFVDLLRIGDGVKEGGLRGWGKDSLRFIAVFPYGKAANKIKTLRGTSAARLIADIGGPNCFWVASAKALRQTGHRLNGKLFASVEDLARAIGTNIDNLWVIPNLTTGMSHLRRVGATVGPVKKVPSLRDIIPMVPNDGSVLMIAVRLMKEKRVIGKHAIYAYKDLFRRVRFFDRTVGAKFSGATRGIFKSTNEIAPYYGATSIVPYEAAILQNVYIKSVGFEIPKLAIPILGVIAEEGK